MHVRTATFTEQEISAEPLLIIYKHIPRTTKFVNLLYFLMLRKSPLTRHCKAYQQSDLEKIQKKTNVRINRDALIYSTLCFVVKNFGFHLHFHFLKCA
jgi:hypothetical protein